MEAIQSKLKKQQEKMAKLMSNLEKQKKAIQDTLYKQGALVRQKYLTNPTVVTALYIHGGVTPRNLSRLAVAIGKKTRARPVTTIAKSLRTRENADIARMQNEYRRWYNSLSKENRAKLAENIHKVNVPNNTNRRISKNSDDFNLAMLRNLNITVPLKRGERVGLVHRLLYNLNDPKIINAMKRHGNPVPMNRLKNMILARNGIRAGWFPGTYNYYHRYPNYRRLTGTNENKYVYRHFY
jgi:hypothetical protein